MSLLNDASLILTPNAVKEGKLYSVIPSNGNGDMTVVRATPTATRTNELGLIEPTPYNLLNHSEMFSDILWVKQAVSITPNTTTAPNGTLTADTFTGNGVSTNHYIYQNKDFTSGTTYSISVYAKKNTNDFIQLASSAVSFQTNHFANFDLSNGTIGRVGSSTTASIESVGNGWYRLRVTATAVSTGNFGPIFLTLINSSTSNWFETNTLSTSVFLWGAQLVQGSVPKDYFYTTDRLNVPRLNYDSVGGCPSILVEPQRTNLVLRSEEFENASWVKTNAAITSNVIISPNNTLTADKLIPSATPSVNKYIYQTPTTSNGTNHSITVFAKLAEYNRLRIEQGNDSRGAWFNLSNGTIGTVSSGATAEIKNMGDGWYRCSINVVSVATNVFFLITGSNTESIQVGDGTSGIYIWGAQLELGAYVTSYIPTVATSITRNSDAIYKIGISDLIGQTEGTFFIDFQNKANEITTGVAVRMLYSITDGTANNRFSHAIVRTPTRNYTDITIRSNNVTVSNINVDTTTGRFKIAVSYKIGATKMFINGVLVGNVGLAQIPIIDRLFLGCSSTSGGESANVGISNFLTVKTALTDAECIALTTL